MAACRPQVDYLSSQNIDTGKERKRQILADILVWAEVSQDHYDASARRCGGRCVQKGSREWGVKMEVWGVWMGWWRGAGDVVRGSPPASNACMWVCALGSHTHPRPTPLEPFIAASSLSQTRATRASRGSGNS